MSPARRADRALFLAATALLGMVVAPLLHALTHAREVANDEAEAAAIARAWASGSSDPLDALAFALEHAHRSPPSEDRGRPQEHSHGPGGSGPHGSGTLEHYCLALHAPPQAFRIVEAAADPLPPAAIVAQLRGTLCYLVPERSQAPPARC
jgi:hypothetical protein